MADRIDLPVGGGQDFPTCPEGMQQAVCVDGIDLGYKVESYMNEAPKPVRKYALVFQTMEEDEDDMPYEVSVDFTASLGEKAALRKFVNSWRGKDLTPEEASGFDITKLVGANALLNIEHKTSAKGRTYAKVKTANPLMKGMKPFKSAAYERAKFWGLRKDDYLAEYMKFNGQPIPPGVQRAPALSPAAPAIASARGSIERVQQQIEEEEASLPF